MQVAFQVLIGILTISPNESFTVTVTIVSSPYRYSNNYVYGEVPPDAEAGFKSL